MFDKKFLDFILVVVYFCSGFTIENIISLIVDVCFLIAKKEF